MPLSAAQRRTVAQAILKLAISGVPPVPGGTIAQQAGAAAHAGAGGGHGGSGGPKKVASALGAKHYGLPIGSLIIPHEHFIAGAPSHFGHYMSKATWIAHEWKKRPEADKAAHAAVEAGTHRWVQSGDNEFAVHKGVAVHVPKHTDMSNPAEVAKAPKLFIHHGQNPERLMANHQSPGEPHPHSASDNDLVEQNWKPLHEADAADTPSKAVSFNGKHAGWVPQDWKAYKAPQADEDTLHGKWLKKPDGSWHLMDQAGNITPAKGKGHDDWVKNGDLVPDDGQSDDHGIVPTKEGAQPGKTDVGGVAVTKEELQSAIAKLSGSKSTQIKGLLKDHPLSASDYGSVYKAELEKHPHLKVPPGTKKAHVPEAKNAFIHHLARKVRALSNDEAGEAAAKEVQEKAADAADHAQQLTPHEITVPKEETPGPDLPEEPDTEPEAPTDITVPKAGEMDSITASKEDVGAAIEALNASKSTAIKGPLKAKGNKLADVDYWAVIHAYEAAHPNTSKGKGTKQAHVPNAKQMFIAALQEKLDGLAKADKATGHDDAAELYDLVSNGSLKSDSAGKTGALARAAVKAVKNDHAYYAWAGGSGHWWATATKPDDQPAYYKVTPELKLTHHSLEFPDGVDSKTLLWNVVHMWVDPPAEKEGEPAPAAPEPEPLPQLSDVLADAKATKEWKNDPGWATLDAHVNEVMKAPELLYAMSAADAKQKIANLLVNSHAMQLPLYLVKHDGDTYAQHSAPAPGTYAAPGDQWWEIKPDHQIIFHNTDGAAEHLPMDVVKAFMNMGTKKPSQILDSPPEEEGEKLTVGEHTYHLAPGDAVFKSALTNMHFIRHVDGSWTTADKYDGVHKSSKENNKGLDDWATGNITAKMVAVNDAAKKFQLDNEPKPEPKTEEPLPDLKVYLKGVHAVSLPAGSKVYYHTASGPSAVTKYAKTPDGQWHYVEHDGLHNALGGNSWNNTVAESGSYTLEKYDSNGMPSAPEKAPEAPAPAPDPAAEEVPAAGVPAIFKGEIVGEWPAGAQLYNKTVGSYQGLYAKVPVSFTSPGGGGNWYQVTASGVSAAPNYKVNDTSLENKYLEKAEPPSAEEIASAKDIVDLKGLVKFGTVDPAKGGVFHKKVFKTWQLAVVHQLTEKKPFSSYYGSSDITVLPQEKGGFAEGYPQSGYEEHWTLNTTDMTVKHWAASDTTGVMPLPELVPVGQLLEAAKRYIVANSVVIDGKQHKYGWWKKPKGSAYLEIKPYTGHADSYKHGTAAFAEYHYHSANGSVKEVTPAYAAKYLDGAENLADEPTPGVISKPVTKVTHAQVATPGTYHVFSKVHEGAHPDQSLDLKGDSSGVLTGGGNPPAAFFAETIDSLFKGGMILDQYGTSVVRPGTAVESYHLFGGAPKTKDDLEAFKKFVEDNWGSGDTNWPAEFSKLLFDAEHQDSILAVFPHKNLLKTFMGDKISGAVGGTAQRNAVYQLVKELLAVPQMEAGTNLGSGGTEPPKEIVFLKTMPPGIAKASDVFKFTQDGWAEPFDGNLNYAGPASLSGLTASDLKDIIGKISQQFGDGKVVGTHLSMPKYSLVDWVTNWKQGDMQAVFNLDAAAGKVSPAHPGAPGNTATHSITWSPADPLQVPASKDIEGAWSDLKHGDVPAKEADNYLLAMHFQYGEYLQPYQRQMVVKAHRGHNQDAVDDWTRTARQNFEAGGTHTGPLEWTDGLKPANPYDSYLEQQTTAENWTIAASKSFVEDHQADLEPYAATIATEYGYTGGAKDVLSSTAAHYLHEKAIQAWLDDAHAKEIAKQMVPVWKKVDTGQLPSHGHEVWKAVKEIPYTGDKSTWFVKPAPDGKAFRLEQEHAANKLGQLFGFKSAESHLLEGEKAFGGQLVQAQKAVPGTPLGHYTDMPAWSDFTPQQISDMATEHLLDTVLFNDDTSANNMIKTPDGHLVGIDKGRSWGNMDWPALAGDHSMDSMTQLVYTKLYDAIRSGAVSKDTADQAYIAVIQKARKMAAVPDASVRKLLEQGFEHRTKFGQGGKEALIQKVLDAKNNLAKNAHDMWAKVYEDAGFGKETSDFGPGMPWGGAPETDSPRYGMVVFNDKGEVLLREAKGHYKGSAWTFAKGGANTGENPLQAAIREAAEETKYKFNPVGYVPGKYVGSSTTTYYFLASAKDAKFVPEMDNGETEQTKWVPISEAHTLIDTSESEAVRARDHSVLEAAAKEWGSGKYHAAPMDVNGMGSPLPVVPIAKLPQAPGGHTLYAGFSEPGFTDSVAAGKSHGVPAFFGGPDLRDMHMLVWQTNSGDTKTTHGETFLKGTGYNKVLGWLAKQAGKEASPGSDDKSTVYTDAGMPGRAPADSPNRGGIDSEKNFYNTIITAARTVTRHKSDGQYNATALSNLDQAEKDIENLAKGADAVINSPSGGGSGAEWAKNAKEMSVHYLDLIAQVRKAKEGAFGFTSGELPRWLPTSSEPQEEAKSELEQLGYKVTYGHSSQHQKGKLDDKGEFQAGLLSGSEDPGKWYHVTLPSGEQIEVGNGQSSGVHLVHHGRVRFTTSDHSSASLENIRSAMKLMGLDMHEADSRDFELFYWRHLLAMLDDRKDGHQGKQQKVWDTLKDQFGSHGLSWTHSDGDGRHRQIMDELQKLGDVDPEAETDIYRHAFAQLTSEAQVADWADRGGFLPHLKHFDPNSPMQAGGKPDWYRFDLADKVKNFPAPIRQSSHEDLVADQTVKSGGTYGKDALMRVAGATANGMGNPYASGGPAYVFTRLNVSSKHTMWSPLALARTHNYSFSDDSYGEWKQRKTGASWSHEVWSKYKEGSNETMISDALSVLDDLELVAAQGETQRQELIKWLKDRGVTHIRFMPVEDRVVTNIGAKEEAKVKANWAAHPELLDPLAEPYSYSGEPGPAQTAFEDKAATAGLDTTPSAEAADAGTDKHVKYILSIENDTPGKGPEGIYQSGQQYYVKYPNGNWFSYEADEESDETSGPWPEGEAMAGVLNNNSEPGGTLKQVWSPGVA